MAIGAAGKGFLLQRKNRAKTVPAAPQTEKALVDAAASG
jgi:hypothetical protein